MFQNPIAQRLEGNFLAGQVVPKKKSFLNTNLILVIITITLISAFGFYVVNKKNISVGEALGDSDSQVEVANTQSEEKEILARDILTDFGAIYEIPPDEVPTIIAITDANKLRESEPEFYANAKNGDKLIVFTTKKLAFIFRQEEKKIINTAPVQLAPK